MIQLVPTSAPLPVPVNAADERADGSEGRAI